MRSVRARREAARSLRAGRRRFGSARACAFVRR
ncbi:type III secretion system protein [Burkholderia stagnalis]|nr:type III secretion system protein [Burkholderia stagnalis]RQQ20669.1 type III secretion system protein [Burkholderia stagnalis]RQQ35945.1 type III secretion system protein [Burkholderia stagnalis]RQQ39604.1 type III secretion system protein [Burkholderia stagnalis]RQQ40289.1 type III secretion system protein [Burkholderia stagnalis]